MLGHELPILEWVRVHDPVDGVAEDVGVVAIVEPSLQLFQIRVNLRNADLVEGPDDGSPKEAPHAFDARASRQECARYGRCRPAE